MWCFKNNCVIETDEQRRMARKPGSEARRKQESGERDQAVGVE
jgi:hypothetical protein